MVHRGRMCAEHRTGMSSWEAIVSNGKSAGDRHMFRLPSRCILISCALR